MKQILFFLIAMFLLPFTTFSQDEKSPFENMTEAEFMVAYLAYSDSITSTFQYEDGEIIIGDNIATIDVPKGYRFLNASDAETVLTKLWGNPPSDPGDESLGMLLPERLSPMDSNVYVMNFTFSEEGYIDDSDAKNNDYDDLLQSMKDDAEASNEERMALGYGTVQIIGWASPPFYDEENKKLHWAIEAAFDGSPDHTLNYKTRILGRKGFINMNAIGGMESLPMIKKDIDKILESVQFQSGNKYSDFNPDLDKVAGYGIAGLIAGKVLLKAGILAKLGLILAKGWKFILLALAAIAALIINNFGGKDAKKSPYAKDVKEAESDFFEEE